MHHIHVVRLDDRRGIRDHRELVEIVYVPHDAATFRIAFDVRTQFLDRTYVVGDQDTYSTASACLRTYCITQAMLPSVSANSATFPTPGMSATFPRIVPPAAWIAATLSLIELTLIVHRKLFRVPAAAG